MEKYLRSIVNQQIILTIVIALIGALIIIINTKFFYNQKLLWLGVTIMLASPYISYYIIYKIYKNKI